MRPARYIVTDDDLVVASSEVGVLNIPEEKIIKKWRLQPGKMFLADLEQGRIIDDDELKRELVSANPYQIWLDQTQIKVEKLPSEVAARISVMRSLPDPMAAAHNPMCAMISDRIQTTIQPSTPINAAKDAYPR